jgi:flagellar biosynthesis GTPase FlhF
VSILKHTLFIDTESGTTSIRDLIRTEYRTDERNTRTKLERNPAAFVTVEHCETFNQIQAAYWRVMRKQYDPMPDVVVFDSITATASSHRRTVVLESLKKSTKGAFNPENIKDADLIDLVPDRREWGITNHNLITVLWPIRRLPMLTIFTAHERMNEDSVTSEKTIGPAVSPQLLGDILDFTDDAFRLTSSKKEEKIEGIAHPRDTRVLRIAASETHATKIRISRHIKIPEVLVNPSLWTVKNTLKDFMPDHMIVFGPRGAGKTTFVASLSDPEAADLPKAQLQSTKEQKVG